MARERVGLLGRIGEAFGPTYSEERQSLALKEDKRLSRLRDDTELTNYLQSNKIVDNTGNFVISNTEQGRQDTGLQSLLSKAQQPYALKIANATNSIGTYKTTDGKEAKGKVAGFVQNEDDTVSLIIQRPDGKFGPKTWFSSEDKNDQVVKLPVGEFKDFMTQNYRAIDARVTKAFVDALGIQATSVAANSVTLGTDTTGNYVQTITGTANKITVSGSGSESADITLTLPDDVQIADSLTVAGNLTVNGTLTSLDTTNLDIEDNLFQLNAGLTGSPVNDSGMLINRGNQNNGIFMWDESVDKFTMGLTTANGSATGNITLASLGTLVVNVEGNLTGAVTGNSSTATTLQTPRSIALSGDVSASAVNFDWFR